MKKLFVMVLVLLMALTAHCFASEVQGTDDAKNVPDVAAEAAALRPDQVRIGEHVFSYTDVPNEAMAPYTVVTKKFSGTVMNTETPDGLLILANPLNEIRCITIVGSEVETYNGISVGDSIDDVKAMYPFFTETKKYVDVLFDGEEVKDPVAAYQNREFEDGWIWISYTFEDGVVKKIAIFDYMFGQRMK